MAQVIYPCEETFRGPWLLEREGLDSLDAVIKEQMERLEARRKHLLENAIRREKDQLHNTEEYKALDEAGRKEEDKKAKMRVESAPAYAEGKCVVTLTLSSKSRVVEDSFGKAAMEPACESHSVVKAEVKLTCGDITAEIVVPTPEKNSPLRVVTLPEGSEAARETFTKFRLWAEDHKPDWLRIINGLPPIAIFAFALSLSILLSMLTLLIGSRRGGESWAEEAKDVLEKKMTPELQGRALQLLLRKEVYGRDPEIEVSFPYWVRCSIVMILIATLLLVIQATTAFEIGKGKTSVKWQKWYAGILRRILPAFLLMGVVASALGSYVFEYLRTK